MAGLSVQNVSNGVPSWLLGYRTKLDTVVSSNNADNIKVTFEMHTSLRNTLQQYPDGSVELLCLGPLTNVASWFNDKETAIDPAIM